MALRYDFPIEGISHTCMCGKPNSMEHCLSCPLGGYVHLRHNQIRDLTANLLSEAGCTDVTIEPHLLPITGEKFKYKSANTEDQARLDVSARKVWVDMDKTFLDIRVFNSRADSNIKKSLNSALASHEKEKKRVYNERILEVEKASFTPIVFSTTGTMGREAERFYRRLAVLLSGKTKQSIPDAVRYIRQRLSFCLLKTLIVSLRGYRGKTITPYYSSSIDIHLLFNLLPQCVYI